MTRVGTCPGPVQSGSDRGHWTGNTGSPALPDEDGTENREDMGEKENHEAAGEARHDVAVHPERSSPHEEAMVRYLSGVAYRESHRRRVSKTAHSEKEREPRGER